MSALTKADLTELLREKFKFPRQDAKRFVEDFFDTLAELIKQEEDVKISGFGNFSVKKKTARPGRNPKTGESVLITDRRVVTFKPSQKMKMRVEQSSITK